MTAPDPDRAVAEDGTIFRLQTERVRGEPAFHTIMRWNGQQWLDIRGLGEYRKSTARAQMRRAARDWKGTP